MKISELITELQAIQEHYGDIPVVVYKRAGLDTHLLSSDALEVSTADWVMAHSVRTDMGLQPDDSVLSIAGE